MDFATIAVIVLSILIVILIIVFSNKLKKQKEEFNKQLLNSKNEYNQSIVQLKSQVNDGVNRLKKEIEKDYHNVIDDTSAKQKQYIDGSLTDIYKSISTQNSSIREYYETIKQEIDYTKNDVLQEFSNYKDSNTTALNVVQTELNEKIIENNNKQKDLIQQLNELINDNNSNNYSVIEKIVNSLNSLNKEHADLKEKVEFFANIDEDSKKLNVASMTTQGKEAENKLIDDAILEMLNKKSSIKISEETISPIQTKNIDSHPVTISDNTKEETADNQTLESVADDNKEIPLVETIETDMVTLVEDEEESVIEQAIENFIIESSDEQNDTYQQSEVKVDDENVPSILDANQKEAFKTMTYHRNNLLITGRAGTGKSLLLNMFSKVTNKKILILAPTGIAALNVGGTTVHSAFGFYNLVQLGVDEIDKFSIKLNSKQRSVLQNVDTIIIDEISMLRADVLEKIDRILKCVNDSNGSFGGKQMIFIGDPFQLPPVVKKDERMYLENEFGGSFFFNAPAYEKGNFEFVELTVNHRQDSDPTFFDILNHIREATVRKTDIEKLNERLVAENDKSLHRVIRLYAKREEVERTNNAILSSIYGREYTFESEIEYNKYSNNEKINIESNFPFSKTLRLKIGANVMFVANDKDERWVNGSIGIVKGINEDIITVSLDGKDVLVEKVAFSQKEASYINGKITYEEILVVRQFPIVLAYAITIHKSQGMTYPKIVCDLSNCFDYGQEYVALSRVTSLQGLYLLKPIVNEIKVSPQILKFYLGNITRKENKIKIQDIDDLNDINSKKEISESVKNKIKQLCFKFGVEHYLNDKRFLSVINFHGNISENFVDLNEEEQANIMFCMAYIKCNVQKRLKLVFRRYYVTLKDIDTSENFCFVVFSQKILKMNGEEKFSIKNLNIYDIDKCFGLVAR